MFSLSLNDQSIQIDSIESLGASLDEIEEIKVFELWASFAGGASLCMLRNEENSWLMYLHHEGDSGFTSMGDSLRQGSSSYTLSNGQVDEYPLSWCIEREQCLKHE